MIHDGRKKSGPSLGKSFIQSELTTGLTTAVDYEKLRMGQHSNFTASMSSGGAGLGAFFGSIASAAGSDMASDRKRADQLRERAAQTGMTVDQVLAEEGRQAQQESEKYAGAGILMGFARRFRDGFAGALGVDEVATFGEKLGNLIGGPGSFQTDREGEH